MEKRTLLVHPFIISLTLELYFYVHNFFILLVKEISEQEKKS